MGGTEKVSRKVQRAAGCSPSEGTGTVLSKRSTAKRGPHMAAPAPDRDEKTRALKEVLADFYREVLPKEKRKKDPALSRAGYDPEDAVQDVALNEVRRLVQEDKDYPAPPLRTLIKRVHYQKMSLRRRARSKPLGISIEGSGGETRPPELEDTGPQPFEVEEANYSRLYEAIERLPTAQSSAIKMHYLENMPLPDVATALGCSGSTVRSNICRGLDRLRTRPLELLVA